MNFSPTVLNFCYKTYWKNHFDTATNINLFLNVTIAKIVLQNGLKLGEGQDSGPCFNICKLHVSQNVCVKDLEAGNSMYKKSAKIMFSALFLKM